MFLVTTCAVQPPTCDSPSHSAPGSLPHGSVPLCPYLVYSQLLCGTLLTTLDSWFSQRCAQIAELQRLEAARLAEAQRSLVRALSCFDEAIVLLDLTSPTEWRIKYANGA